MQPRRLVVAASVAAAALAALPVATGFYLPGVAPANFVEGQRVELKVNKITSTQTQIPYDYYSFPFCRPANGVHHYGENLGEFLTGDRIENSPYEIQMKVDQSCSVLCARALNKKDVKKLKEAISEGYSHNWIIDNLPAASVTVDDVYQTTYYSRGFLVGLTDEKQETFVLHNHVRIYLDFHQVDGQDAFRVVGFRVRPFSVDHKQEDGKVAEWNGAGTAPALSTCADIEAGSVGPAEVKEGAIIYYSYDVQWEASEVRWASRWDIYLNMDHTKTDKVHWFSIANSALIVLFLTGMIAMILIRNLCRDITRYNRVPTEEERAEEREESGWKLVHADVFRPPTSNPMLLAVMVGTGAQLLSMAFFTIVFAAVGFLSPANRGSLMIAVLLTYVLMGSVAGYISARLYKTFKGKQWQKCTVFTALWYPSICFAVFLCLDLIDVSYGSSVRPSSSSSYSFYPPIQINHSSCLPPPTHPPIQSITRVVFFFFLPPPPTHSINHSTCLLLLLLSPPPTHPPTQTGSRPLSRNAQALDPVVRDLRAPCLHGRLPRLQERRDVLPRRDFQHPAASARAALVPLPRVHHHDGWHPPLRRMLR